MMKSSNEIRIRQNLSSRINKAAFVQIDHQTIGTFKYYLVRNIRHRCSTTGISIKRYLNSRLQRVQYWVALFSWKKIGADLVTWCIETMLEGLSLNFATHYLLGMPFNMMTAFAHGIVVKQGLSICWRLRVNGATTKLPKKNE